MGFIALTALGLLLTAAGVTGLIDDLALSRQSHSAARCTGADRADLHAPCLHTVTAAVTSSAVEGRGSHVVRITLKAPEPVGGDVRLDDPPDAFYHVHAGDRVTVTVWSGINMTMTVHGHTHRTEDSPGTNVLVDLGAAVSGVAMSVGGVYMTWLWFFRREELSYDLSELKAVGGWVGGQCALVLVLGILRGYATLTVFLILWGAFTVPMSLWYWIKLRYD
ncbi:hypothetical protein ACH4S8_31560 [Streptomyces sp. NPDC021080]|uniref:hypothetical protein n=1 Tax=Streptomyces sp. NPDC021080 TaxID=3365110 RepID=UPI0037B6F6B0